MTTPPAAAARMKSKKGMVFRFDFFDKGKREKQGDGECQVYGALEGSRQDAEEGGVHLETGKGDGDQEGDLVRIPVSRRSPNSCCSIISSAFFTKASSRTIVSSILHPSFIWYPKPSEIGIAADSHHNDVS